MLHEKEKQKKLLHLPLQLFDVILTSEKHPNLVPRTPAHLSAPSHAL